MKKVIYKYKLYGGVTPTILPKGYEILSVIEQFDDVVLYCLVNPDETETVSEKFSIYGTGWALDEELFNNKKFIGTVSTDGGQLIWHVFKGVAE